jgi:hypothetical protein
VHTGLKWLRKQAQWRKWNFGSYEQRNFLTTWANTQHHTVISSGVPTLPKQRCIHLELQALLPHHPRFLALSHKLYEGVSKSFGTGHLERQLQMVQLSAIRCSCITVLWVSLKSFAAITFSVASQREIPKVSVYFVIDSVRKLLDTTSYKYIDDPVLSTMPWRRTGRPEANDWS